MEWGGLRHFATMWLGLLTHVPRHHYVAEPNGRLWTMGRAGQKLRTTVQLQTSTSLPHVVTPNITARETNGREAWQQSGYHGGRFIVNIY